MSLPEVLLWQRLRQSDLHIRRQHPEGHYVTDFFCAAANTIIEVDGAFHDLQSARDARRDERLRLKGLRTIRIDAKSILTNPDAVAAAILLELGDCVERQG